MGSWGPGRLDHLSCPDPAVWPSSTAHPQPCWRSRCAVQASATWHGAWRAQQQGSSWNLLRPVRYRDLSAAQRGDGVGVSCLRKLSRPDRPVKGQLAQPDTRHRRTGGNTAAGYRPGRRGPPGALALSAHQSFSAPLSAPADHMAADIRRVLRLREGIGRNRTNQHFLPKGETSAKRP